MKHAPSHHHHCLKRLRQACGLSQAQLARQIGASLRTVIAVETGQRRLTEALARRLRTATGVDPRSLQDKNANPLNLAGRPYSPKDFQRWTGKDLDSEEIQLRDLGQLLGLAEQLKSLLSLLDAAKERGRLSPVVEALQTEIENASQDFDLETTRNRLLSQNAELYQQAVAALMDIAHPEADKLVINADDD